MTRMGFEPKIQMLEPAITVHAVNRAVTVMAGLLLRITNFPRIMRVTCQIDSVDLESLVSPVMFEKKKSPREAACSRSANHNHGSELFVVNARKFMRRIYYNFLFYTRLRCKA
jgi:hypothetical protein